jgi:hypothetical protein
VQENNDAKAVNKGDEAAVAKHPLRRDEYGSKASARDNAVKYPQAKHSIASMA